MRFVPVLVFSVVAACSPGGESVTTTTAEPPATSASTSATTTSTDSETSSSGPTTTTTVPSPELQGLAYEVVADGLGFPMIVTPWTGEMSLVGFRDGRVHSFDGSSLSENPLFDLDVSTDGERGLLGMDAADGDVVYVHYSDPAGDTVVAAVTVTTGEQQVLLTVDQPAANHNGGMIQVGPDAMLYVGLGDGGGSNDRFGHGQNPETLLGGIVRIDPSSADAELWSYGLRNPYRFWIDGDLIYIGDVGQNAYEEVDVVGFDREGFNFGWPITEGFHCFSPQSGCDVEGLTLPVLEIEHGDAGTCSITGGVVYRGTAIPELEGHYLYSDYCGGWLRSFLFENGEVVDPTDWTDDVGVGGNVVSFGVDHTGEVYVLTTDAIRRIVPVR
ncbi:MAG: PQQ-dependent sugar dehydrogenase [Acidimicrobiia bacterium]